MAEEAQQNTKDLPKVLVLGSPTCFQTLQQLYSHKFNFINPNTFTLSLQHFLQLHHHHPSSIPAVICSANYAITAEFLRFLPALRLVLTTSAGTNHIDLPECRRRGIQVAGAGELFSEDVADMAVALLIDVMKKISTADRCLKTQNRSNWDFFTFDSKLSEKRIGIVGLGSIGMLVAKRLESFGCIILYNSKHQNATVSYPFYSSVVELATTCDALVLCCALNEQTKHIINRKVILALGKGGFVVNVGRGALIDEKELIKCLMEGEIGGAGLDVFENEPHVPKELLEMNNVVLSPHCAAFTFESLMNLCELLGGNLEAFFSDKSLVNLLTME